MRSLFIHVGPHKTGTTSIQEFLRQESGRVEDLGASVFLESSRIQRGRNDAARANAWALAHCFIRAELPTPMRLNGSQSSEKAACEQQVDRFRDWARTSRGDRLIVSSEAFSFLRTEAEAEALERCFEGLFDRIVPIIAFREVGKRRRSWDRQLDTMGVAGRIASLGDAERVDADWYFDWEALRGFWERFGEPRIIDYDAALEQDGSILPAFLAAAELDAIDVETDYFLNETLDRPRGVARVIDRIGRFTKRL
ncbi:MAG: hypothetical protein RIB52_02685 [Erythrobacter sp.]